MGEQHLFIAQSSPAPGREDEYNRWYDVHLREVVESIDGFAAGQRYRLSDLQREDSRPAPWRYVTLYELEGDVDEIHESNRRVRESGVYTPYEGLIGDDHVGHVFTPVGEPYRKSDFGGRTEATHVLIVRSNPGPLGDDAYNAWYDNHIHEVVDSIDGYMGAQRYELNPSQRPGMTPSRWRYVNVYEVRTGDLAAVYRSNLAARERGAFTPNRGELADDYSGQMYERVGGRFAAPLVAAVG